MSRKNSGRKSGFRDLARRSIWRLWVVLTLLACSSGAFAQEVTITEKARTHFKAGVNLLQDPAGPRYDEAYHQFKAAYAESPSWKILGNLGLAAMHLERYGEAIDAFKAYLEQGAEELSDQEREQYQRDLETLEASVATVTITAPPKAEISDLRSSNRGADVRNYYVVPESGVLSIGVRPGQHVVTATIDGQEAGKWSVVIESSASKEHTFSKKSSTETAGVEPAASAQSKPNRVPAYVALGIGAVGIGVGTAFVLVRGGHNKKAGDEYDACVDSGTCGSTEQESIEGWDEKAATAGTISLISYGVGVAGIGTGIALLLIGADSGERPLEAKVGRVAVSPFASAQHVGLIGTF